jgi:hypothetical protein
MDHQDALEQLELAAVEAGGLDRLMAGDTPTAAAVAGHLAGCEVCADELERLRRAVPLLRDVVRTTPPADLRDRTLAFVRAAGIPRGADADTAALIATETPVPGGLPAASQVAAAAAAPTASGARRRAIGMLPWVASIAAAVVISVVASTVVIGNRVDQQLAEQDRAIAGLEAVTAATLEITADPDAERVALASTGGSDASGSLLFSPTTTELVVVADGLESPPDGLEYRCWLLVDGVREDVGRMYFADELAFWVGVTPGVAAAAPGTTFGVSLTESDGSGPQTDPVIAGEL